MEGNKNNEKVKKVDCLIFKTIKLKKEVQMRRIYIAIVLASVLGLVNMSYADQVNVNIAYPLNGGSYKISPDYPFLTISFSVTCKDLEDHKVK